MRFSLNEIETTAKKAARGAGFSWGMAEEASKATRWLIENGIDGPKALATVLAAVDVPDPAEMAPIGQSWDWHATSGELCPLMAGAALSDCAGYWPTGGVSLKMTIMPVMLLPFAGFAARHRGSTVTVEWDGVLAVTDGFTIGIGVTNEAELMIAAASVEIRAGGEITKARLRQNRGAPNATDWSVLAKFADRTYAPSTDESRLKGAGAGLADND